MNEKSKFEGLNQVLEEAGCFEMDEKSKSSQSDSKKVKSVDTNETHLFSGIISFIWRTIFRK